MLLIQAVFEAVVDVDKWRALCSFFLHNAIITKLIYSVKKCFSNCHTSFVIIQVMAIYGDIKHNTPIQITKLIQYLNKVLVPVVFHYGKLHHNTFYTGKIHHCNLYFITVYSTAISHHVDCLFYLLIVLDLLRFNTRKTEISPYLERRLRSNLTASVFRSKFYLIINKIVFIICRK